MNNPPAVYMSQEQINALFMRDSAYDGRQDRISSLKNENQGKNEIWKTDGNEGEENRPTNQSESMMMITREEYMGLQGEYDRRKDMEEKYKDDINKLMREMKQQGQENEQLKRDLEIQKEQTNRRESTIQTLRTQISEANNREKKAIMELADQHEEHLTLKQSFEILQQKYNNLLKSHKFELERKDKLIDQLKQQLFIMNEENEKLKNYKLILDDKYGYLDSQRQSVDKMQNTWQQGIGSSHKSSIQFSKDSSKPIVQIQSRSNYDSKITFGKKTTQQQQQQQQQQQYE